MFNVSIKQMNKVFDCYKTNEADEDHKFVTFDLKYMFKIVKYMEIKYLDKVPRTCLNLFLVLFFFFLLLFQEFVSDFVISRVHYIKCY